VLQGVGAVKQAVTFGAPGVYDVDVTVDDGVLSSLATASVAVLPGGTRYGANASNWSYTCSSGTSCATITSDPNGIAGSAVHVNSSDPFLFSFSTPVVANAASLGHIGFFLKAHNPNGYGWQNFYVVVHTATGALTYTPPLSVLPVDPSNWTYFEIPLAGGTDQGVTWALTGSGSLSSVQSIEIDTDTWGGTAYDIWVNALSLY
jgi:hypothetical protein